MGKRFHVIFIFLILGMLFTPFLSMISGLEPRGRITENRRLHPFPAMGKTLRSLTDFPAEYTLYFEDHYGFRNALSHWHVRLMIGVLKVPIFKEMIIGKGNWLFWGGDGILESYRTPAPLEKEALEKLTKIHERQNRYCAERGIRYLFVTPPNTFSVYPEFLPDFLTISTKPVSHSDQLIAYLKAHTQIDLVDLKPVLMSAKKKEKVYFESDSHWNDMGAFVGYTETMKIITRWYPHLSPFRSSDFTIRQNIKKDAELAHILGLPDRMGEVYKMLTPKTPYTWKRSAEIDPFYQEHNLVFPKTLTIVNANSTSRLTAVMFIDSFFFNMAPFFNQHFSRVVYVYKVLGYDNFDTRIIDHENPDMVFCEIGERFFLKVP